MARREFVGRLIAAGPTRTLTGEPGRYVVPAEAVRRAVEEGLFRGLACFVDHAAGRPSLRRLLGVWYGVTWDEASGAAVGRLRAYETATTRPIIDLLAQVLGEAEPPDLGISLVFYPRLAADGRTVTAIVMVESADVVMFPASAGSRIVAQAARPGEGNEWRAPNAPEHGERPGRGNAARAGDRGGDAPGWAANGDWPTARAATFAPWSEGARAYRLTAQNEEERGTRRTQRRHGEHGEESADSLCSSVSSLRALRVPSDSGQTGTRRTQRRHGEHGEESADSLCSSVSSLRALRVPSDSGQTGTRRTQRRYGEHGEDRSMSTAMDDMNPQEDEMDERAWARAWAEDAPLALVAEADEAAETDAYEPDAADVYEAERAPRRVRLVARPSGAEGGGAISVAARPPELAVAELAETWRQSAAGMVIRAAGLPGPVQERLLRGHYDSVDEVEAAVAGARAELAALTEAGVVRLGGIGGWGGARRARLRDGLDEARELVGYFFGAADAPEPPPNLRNFADLYVALTGDVHFRGVFDGERAQFSGATTATLPNLAVDAMNRVIVEQFQALEHYRWYERVSTAEPNDGTLQEMKWITLGGIGNLPTVSEGAAYTELSISDVKETAAFVKRGGYVGITREMIKNSNILQLQAIPRALAAAAVRTRSAAVAGLFTANSGVGPTLAQDSKALFHADHANLATTALGTDAAAWRAARAECFQQTEVGSGKALGIFPRYLLVPAELYDTALSLLGYGEGMPTVYTPEAVGRGFADPRPIPLVVPDWTDSADWAYVVDPAVFPVIQMSYSQAPGGRRHPIPELFAVVSETSGLMFSNDILPIKVRDEFALGVNGHRGIGKRNVS